MRRKNDENTDGLEGVAQRLREERPTASPLELDRIKTSAMSRVRGKGMRTAPRRFAAAGLTMGLLMAGTGGVLAAGADHSSSGNAADAQYSGNVCDANNNNANNNNNGDGNENNNDNNNFNCNNNSFNGNTTTNNYYSTTNTTVTVTATSGVQGFRTARARTSSRHIHLHLHLKKGSKLKKVKITLNGKIFSVLTGKHASSRIDLVNLPCTASGASTVTVTATLANGKTIKQVHRYHLCQA